MALSQILVAQEFVRPVDVGSIARTGETIRGPMLDARGNQSDFGVGIEKIELTIQSFGEGDVIGIHPRKIRGCGLFQAYIEGGHYPGPTGGKQTKATVPPSQFPQNAKTRITGTVVNRKQFEVRFVLAKNAVDGFDKSIPGIANWKDDGNAGRSH